MHLHVAHLLTSSLLIGGVFSLPQQPKGQGAGRADTASSLREKTWNPPAYLRKDLDAVWNHTIKTYNPKPDPLKMKNYGYNQVVAHGGKINFCVRWDSKKTADVATRRAIDSALKAQTKKWMDVLVGYDGWPYTEVPVRVVGWAARSPGLLPGLQASEGKFYTDKDRGGVPQCAENCGRFFHQDSKYQACQAGAANHYDMSLWLTDGFKGGAGGDWGQRVATEMFLSELTKKDIHIFLHEMGHTFGLDDYYQWKPPTQKNFVMMAGSATYITEFDAWMLRDWWRHIKPRILTSSQAKA